MLRRIIRRLCGTCDRRYQAVRGRQDRKHASGDPRRSRRVSAAAGVQRPYKRGAHGMPRCSASLRPERRGRRIVSSMLSRYRHRATVRGSSPLSTTEATPTGTRSIASQGKEPPPSHRRQKPSCRLRSRFAGCPVAGSGRSKTPPSTWRRCRLRPKTSDVCYYAEFALVYGNDWFGFPLVVPAGTRTSVESLTGDRLVRQGGRGAALVRSSDGLGGAGWKAFRTYERCEHDGEAPLPSPPSLTSCWVTPGIRRHPLTAPRWKTSCCCVTSSRRWCGASSARSADPSGSPIRSIHHRMEHVAPGAAAALRLLRLPQYQPRHVGAGLLDSVYARGGHVGGTVMLARAKMPQAITERVRVFCWTSTPVCFFEEVPREGVHVERIYRLAHSPSGAMMLWLSRRSGPGRGEGRSGLAFDFIVLNEKSHPTASSWMRYGCATSPWSPITRSFQKAFRMKNGFHSSPARTTSHSLRTNGFA